MKQKIQSVEEIYASSMSRLIKHLDEENVAVITAYISSEDPERPVRKNLQTDAENRNANEALSRELQKLCYGFSKVDGYYRESGNQAPTLERSYYVICPINVAYENFRKTLIALARKYEQQSVLIWSHEKQQAYLYGTTDYNSYTLWETYDTLNIDRAKGDAWSEFRSHNFVFSADNFIIESATQLGDRYYGGGPSCMLAAKHWREQLLSEYSGEPDDANEIICL